MKYIYDILLNFNEELYEFYEWDEEDYYDYVKKIAIFKVSKEDFNEIKNNKIMINMDLVKMLHKSCEVYTNKCVKCIEYACLFCSNSSVIAVEFNYKGISILKSDLLIDESMDIIEFCKKMKPIAINYKIITSTSRVLLTRYESKMLFFMKREINNMYKNNNIEKLKYMYYECFNKNNDNILNIYE